MVDVVALRGDLDAERAPSGAYRCVIDWGGGRWSRDENGFATALVLRRARRAGLDLVDVDRSLDLLERCAAQPEGPYSFWPDDTRPAWAAGVPPDADDTAVITLELYAHGRRSRAEAIATLVDVLVPAAAAPLVPSPPPWWRAGAFPTWLGGDPAHPDNVVDCGVNANVLALMAVLDAREAPGYGAALEMLGAAVEWCDAGEPDDRARRADAIAPYYASPRALVGILDDAVWCGMGELAATRDRLAAMPGAGPGPEDALWRNAYRSPVWRCRALQLLSLAD